MVTELKTGKKMRRRTSVDNKHETLSSLNNNEKHVNMDSSFSTLRSLLPEPPRKKDKSVLISKVMGYIQKLENQIEELKKKRDNLQLSPDNACAIQGRETEQLIDEDASSSSAENDHPAVSSNLSWNCTSITSREAYRQTSKCFGRSVVLDFFDTDLFITVRRSRKSKSIFSQILTLMEDYDLETIHASVSTSDDNIFYSLHVKVVNAEDRFPKEALESALHALID
ncbi:hypothetical protein O6H91_11G082600 [Diphasiastrum complanatum]|uniref:Uncharacterized protein n=1 Tax=Diphasiastrum complanatum TaxID=34168 RepID=A0ACC2CBB1_DIPCM|nr:hypothetical protein O6H91_11G082600 [Diphasiastrum complanatum]